MSITNCIANVFTLKGMVNFRPVSVDANNDALAIMSSSGTTGECKGKFSHDTAAATAAASNIN